MEKELRKNRIKLFAKITELLENMNAGTALLGVKFDIREEYAIEYLEEILKKYIELVGFDPGKPFTEREITKLLNSGSLKSFPSISKG